MKSDSNIAETMSVLLSPATVQKKASVQSAEDAVASLNAAAEILDNMGLFVFAEAVTHVMESVPNALEKSAQTYGHSEEKYVLEALYDGLMAIRSKMSDIRAEEEKHPRIMPGVGQTVTNKNFEALSKIEEALGKMQTKIEDGRAESSYLNMLSPYADMMSRKANALWGDEDPPPAIAKLYKVTDVLHDDNSEQEISRMLSREEEGKDYNEPTVQMERFKEHEYMPEEPSFEEESTLEKIDELWDMPKEHPSHPLYRD